MQVRGLGMMNFLRKTLRFAHPHPVDGSENSANQLRPGEWIPLSTVVLYISGGCLGFLPSTLCQTEKCYSTTF